MSVVAEESVWRRLARRANGQGWASYVWLTYLAFLFVPAIAPRPGAHWLWPTLLSLFVFLLVYLARFREGGGFQIWQPIVIAALGLVLFPFNRWGNTYVIFAVAFVPFVLHGLLACLVFTAVSLALFAIEVTYLGDTGAFLPITSLIATVTCIGNYFSAENRRKNAALAMSQNEIRRLAQLAERERIGRDLHDLLGHTLSLIALKAELAGKLLSRNRETAASEIAQVQQIAREALKEVREAVSGIRAAGLEGELASAGALLESSGVQFAVRCQAASLPAEVEVALAMMVREAVTNIHRHAQASHAEIDIQKNDGKVMLMVSDDGKGGVVSHGNGLTGLCARARALGGICEIDSPTGGGTKLRAVLSVGGAV